MAFYDLMPAGLAFIPAPKLKLPGHEESYNPPKEYLPTEVSLPACQAQSVLLSLLQQNSYIVQYKFVIPLQSVCRGLHAIRNALPAGGAEGL